MNEDTAIYPPKTDDQKQKVDNFVEQANKNPTLREHNVRVVNAKWYDFLSLFFFVLLIGSFTFGGYYLYLVQEDHFKPEILQDINVSAMVQQNITVNSTNNNQYDFKPNINNEYSFKEYPNITINNLVNCP